MRHSHKADPASLPVEDCAPWQISPAEHKRRAGAAWIAAGRSAATRELIPPARMPSTTLPSVERARDEPRTPDPEPISKLAAEAAFVFLVGHLGDVPGSAVARRRRCFDDEVAGFHREHALLFTGTRR